MTLYHKDFILLLHFTVTHNKYSDNSFTYSSLNTFSGPTYIPQSLYLPAYYELF
jgi:hypothetical protein